MGCRPVGNYVQIFQPSVFITAMHIGAIGFYHFVPLSVTLTLSRGHNVSAKEDLLVSFFFRHFSIDLDEI